MFQDIQKAFFYGRYQCEYIANADKKEMWFWRAILYKS